MNKLISIESLVAFLVCLSVGLGNEDFSILGDVVAVSLSIILATIFDRIILNNGDNKNTGSIFMSSLFIFLIALWLYN